MSRLMWGTFITQSEKPAEKRFNPRVRGWEALTEETLMANKV